MSELLEQFSTLLAIELIEHEDSPLLLVIAGHNGAGKSTYFASRLKALVDPLIGDRHIDPDAIEKEIRDAWSGDSVPAAGFSLMAAKQGEADRINYLNAGEDFSFETVLSDRDGHKLDFLKLAIAQGYLVVMMFVGLASADLSWQRVRERHYLRRGHLVPKDTCFDRYPRVLENARCAAELVDLALFVDNSVSGDPLTGAYRDVAVFHKGQLVRLNPYVNVPWFERVH